MPHVRAKLTLSLRENVLIKFSRPFEPGSFTGYVIDIGPRFLLAAVVSDEIRFNGFSCIRLSDVHKLQAPAKYASFIERALQKRRERRPKKPSVSIGSLHDLLLTASRAFPLITIHREKIDAGACHIGRVVDLKNGMVYLHEIAPDAVWEDNPDTYRLSEITRVDFGGDYEDALHLVGGSPKIEPHLH